MTTPMPRSGWPLFYTVRQAAKILTVDPATLYRAIREDGFPAIRIRSRYVIPSAVLDRLIAEAAETGGLVDPRQLAAERQTAREVERLSGGRW